ncbi:uncharacterized protein BKA55DRAFT_561159 [Fusarium redolens]|uniref:Uncharacterized protein n=1 Tax=Fusarium redolens TaxID=48865 RepID=A0A9P9HQM7_FUSRE|nr:uncharacterized protein BKA55DRAFT_561159 [Fusarium redolens]KAH7261392.1 hypothetical protein BKA55DRAFT_561159 [Fusarium redolens]
MHPSIQCRHLILALRRAIPPAGTFVSLLLLWLLFPFSHTPESHIFRIPHSAFLLPSSFSSFPSIDFQDLSSFILFILHYYCRPIVSFLSLHLFQPLFFLLGCLSFSLAGP